MTGLLRLPTTSTVRDLVRERHEEVLAAAACTRSESTSGMYSSALSDRRVDALVGALICRDRAVAPYETTQLFRRGKRSEPT